MGYHSAFSTKAVSHNIKFIRIQFRSPRVCIKLTDIISANLTYTSSQLSLSACFFTCNLNTFSREKHHTSNPSTRCQFHLSMSVSFFSFLYFALHLGFQCFTHPPPPCSPAIPRKAVMGC